MSNSNGKKPVRWSEISGRQARSYHVDRDGERVPLFGPFHVRLSIRNSFLAGSEDTIDMFVYEMTAERAITRAQSLLHKWFVLRRKPFDGYPKCEGQAAAQSMTHRHYTMLRKEHRSAVEGMLTDGVPDDPTAFCIPGKRTNFLFASSSDGMKPMQATDKSTGIPTNNPDHDRII